MSWKSTIDISKEEALKLISLMLLEANHLSSSDIEDLLYKLGFGDNPDLPYFGYNFNIKND